MSPSKLMPRFVSVRSAVMLCMCLFPVQQVSAFESVKIYESTFNEFSNAILPVTMTGRYKLQITVDTYILGKHKITLCDSAYSATVSTLTFDISNSNVDVDGKVSASWCGLGFPDSTLDADGNIYYSASDSNVHFSFASASVKPCRDIRFSFLNTSKIFHVCLPVSINVAPTLNIPPLHIGYARLNHDSPAGERAIYMSPYATTLLKRNGYIELNTEVDFH